MRLTEEQRDKWIHHAITKVAAEPEHGKHRVHGDEGEDDFEPFDGLEDFAEFGEDPLHIIVAEVAVYTATSPR